MTPVAVDAIRLLVGLVAGGTMLQLTLLAWHDRRVPAERHRLPAQLALLLALVRVALDATLRIGQSVSVWRLTTSVLIVGLATWYVLESQGIVSLLRRRAR